MSRYPAILITGPVGVGKTSVAWGVADQLRARKMPYAMLDLDAVMECYPAPPDDPYNFRLVLRNLAALWPNYREAGATRLVLNWVVESRSELADYERSLPDVAFTIVRLRASVETIQARLRQRAADFDLEWALARGKQLAEEMDAAHVEDVLVDTEGKTVDQVAEEILRLVGWCVDP